MELDDEANLRACFVYIYILVDAIRLRTYICLCSMRNSHKGPRFNAVC